MSDMDQDWGLITRNDGGWPSIMLVTPAYGPIELATFRSFSAMQAVSLTAMLRGEYPPCQMSHQLTEGTYIHRGRERLVETALERDVDYIMWIDADMVFPSWTLLKLLETGKKIVGANYCKRKYDDAGFTAIKRAFGDEGDKAVVCATGPESTGIEQVESIGFGVCLTHTSVFEDMPKPWFWYHYLPEINQHVGEDVYFCMQARDVGHTIWVDHNLSQHVGHIGNFEYKNSHAWAAMPAEDLEPSEDRRLEIVAR